MKTIKIYDHDLKRLQLLKCIVCKNECDVVNYLIDFYLLNKGKKWTKYPNPEDVIKLRKENN